MLKQLVVSPDGGRPLHSVGEVVLVTLGNYLEAGPQCRPKMRPAIILRPGECQHDILGLTTKSHSITSGAARPELPLPGPSASTSRGDRISGARSRAGAAAWTCASTWAGSPRARSHSSPNVCRWTLPRSRPCGWPPSRAADGMRHERPDPRRTARPGAAVGIRTAGAGECREHQRKVQTIGSGRGEVFAAHHARAGDRNS